MAINLQHQTPTQLAAKIRERFRNSRGQDAWKIATRLMDWLDAGDITDIQMRNTFGLTVVQWNELKVRLTNMRTRYLELQSTAGE